MTSSEIDSAILAVTQPSWRKVAMIISKTAEKLGKSLWDNDSGYSLIADRIEMLVRDGRLVAQGNVTDWRHSEIRLPSENN